MFLSERDVSYIQENYLKEMNNDAQSLFWVREETHIAYYALLL